MVENVMMKERFGVFERFDSPHPNPLPQGEGTSGETLLSLELFVLSITRQWSLPLPQGEGRGEGEKNRAQTKAATFTTRRSLGYFFILQLLLLAFAAKASPKELSLLGKPFKTTPISANSFSSTLLLKGVAPRGEGRFGDLALELVRVDGQWRRVSVNGARFNRTGHDARILEMNVSDTALQGTVELTVRPDAWVPKDGLVRRITVDLQASIQSTNDVGWTASGKFNGQAVAEDDTSEKVEGTLEGRMFAPFLPGHWHRGTADGQGIEFDLDLGTRRVNWNQFDVALMEFPEPIDLSAFAGLRIRVRPKQPREDAEVSIWLREQDGSWYYHPSTVPLIDKVNSAQALFVDFTEAEWIAGFEETAFGARGFHMDEDFVLDLKSVSHVAVGIVNPHGVGAVSFTLEELTAFGAPSEPRPISVACTGKTLSINGHNLIPAGIFGGYAPDLPQRYRPGCQRGLYPSTTPRSPQTRYFAIGERDLKDWPQLIRALQSEERVSSGIAYLRQHTDATLLKKLEKFNLQKHLAGKNADRVPGDLLKLLNSSLGQVDFYEAASWPVPLADELLKRVKALPDANRTEKIITHRRLLEQLLPDFLHPAGPNPHELFFIDCFGERKERATMLSRDDWRDYLKDWGKSYALNAKAMGYEGVFEFWNEPYLHWNRDKVNMKNNLFREDLARDGGQVTIRRKMGEGEVIPHFEWRRNEKGNWEVVDPTAFTFWSGRGNGWIYDQMLSVIGPAIKEHNPKVRVIGGWGFRWNEDHWAAWDILYKNTIDRNIEWIDGVHEHHYQGDPTGMVGTYEVLTAYGVTAHSKWLYGINTECNDLLDAPARGAVNSPAKVKAATQYRRMSYNLRDIVAFLALSPDKVLGRTVIHPSQEGGSTAVTYGLLKNLRGRLLEVTSSDPKVFAVASVDGTDPCSLPHGFDGTQECIVTVFNDHRSPREIALTLHAPTGTTFADGTKQWVKVDKEKFAFALDQEPVAAAGQKEITLRVQLAERVGATIALPLEGKIVEKDEVQRHQFFSKDILQTVKRDQSFETQVQLDPLLLAQAQSAYLRIVAEHVAEGEGIVSVNGQHLALPKAYTADNVTQVMDLPLDLAGLKPDTRIRSKVNPGNHAGYLVPMTSVVLETRE